MPIDAYLSNGGKGCYFNYFWQEKSAEDVLAASHTVCLAHISDPQKESALIQLQFSKLIQTFKEAEGKKSYLPVIEQTGMFLQVRATCSFALTFCTEWYLEHATRRMWAVTRVLREMDEDSKFLLPMGCVCDACDEERLEFGCMCPDRKHGLHARRRPFM
jgi:hypothetical protein